MTESELFEINKNVLYSNMGKITGNVDSLVNSMIDAYKKNFINGFSIYGHRDIESLVRALLKAKLQGKPFPYEDFEFDANTLLKSMCNIAIYCLATQIAEEGSYLKFKYGELVKSEVCNLTLGFEKFDLTVSELVEHNRKIIKENLGKFSNICAKEIIKKGIESLEPPGIYVDGADAEAIVTMLCQRKLLDPGYYNCTIEYYLAFQKMVDTVLDSFCVKCAKDGFKLKMKSTTF